MLQNSVIVNEMFMVGVLKLLFQGGDILENLAGFLCV